MKATGPEITFDTTAPRSSVEQRVDRVAWEKKLNAPKHPKALPRRVMVEPVPGASEFEAMGQMSEPKPDFYPRQATRGMSVSVVGLTILLGVASVTLWGYGHQSTEPENISSLLGLSEPQAGPEPTGEDATSADTSDLSPLVPAGLQSTPAMTPKQQSRNSSIRRQGANKSRALQNVVLASRHDGGVDKDTMMLTLARNGSLHSQSSARTTAAREMSRKIFAVSPARSEHLSSLRLFTVTQGDSHAYIALQFYGLPDAYSRIIEANRDTLQSPDMIQLGQRLIIPS